MATFIFKLEPVLKMRKHAENILRREVAQLEQAKLLQSMIMSLNNNENFLG